MKAQIDWSNGRRSFVTPLDKHEYATQGDRVTVTLSGKATGTTINLEMSLEEACELAAQVKAQYNIHRYYNARKAGEDSPDG